MSQERRDRRLGMRAAIMLVAAGLVWMLALCSVAAAHEITFSHVDVRLTPARTEVTAQLPIKALLQEEPTSLPPGVGEPALRADPLSAEAKTALTKLLTTRL